MTYGTSMPAMPVQRHKAGSVLLTINPKRTVFYVVFCLVFCLSGLLATLSIVWTGHEYYRMGLVSLVVIPLLLLYGIKVDSVFLAYCALALVTLFSGLYNGTPLGDVVLFMRILVFSYLVYCLVNLYLRPDNSQGVLKWCIVVAEVQLPIVLLQRSLYERFPLSLRAKVDSIDIGSGTFNLKGDAAMAFFAVLLIVFLLFGGQHVHKVRRRWLVLLWLTLTVFVANAELLKLVVMLVWGVYLVVRLRLRTVLYAVLVFVFLAGALLTAGVWQKTWANLSRSVYSNTRMDLTKEQSFLSGGYGRGAAIAYYLSHGVSLLGDGPSAYYDPVDRTRVLGNAGHIFTFYSEVGLLGWLLSVWVFFLIAFPRQHGRRRFTWVNLLSFVAVQFLTFTTQSMNDISVMLVYCIVTRMCLLSVRTV